MPNCFSTMSIISKLYVFLPKLDFSKDYDSIRDMWAWKFQGTKIQAFRIFSDPRFPKAKSRWRIHCSFGIFLPNLIRQLLASLYQPKHMPFCGTLGKSNSNSEKHNKRKHSCLIHEARLKIIPPVHEIYFEITFETLIEAPEQVSSPNFRTPARLCTFYQAPATLTHLWGKCRVQCWNTD